MILEPFTQNGRIAHVIATDPGSQTLGLAVLSFDVETLDIIKTRAQTFTGDKLPYINQWTAAVHGDRIARIHAHRQNLYNILSYYKPILVACESPFYNPRRPNAYGALVEVMTEIRNAVIMYDPYMKLHTIDPPTVKKAVGAAGNADKVAVRAALLKIRDNLKLTTEDIDSMDEHSIDAVAVGYCLFKSRVLPF